LWVGGLWIVGYLVVPALFAGLPGQRMLAGELAGSVFSRIAWVGMACAAYLLVHIVATRRAATLRIGAFWIAAVMLVLTVTGHFGIQPLLAELKAQVQPLDVMQSSVRNQFVLWHGVSSLLHLAQSVLGIALVLVRPGARR
jgi:hypothetical protein